MMKTAQLLIFLTASATAFVPSSMKPSQLVTVSTVGDTTTGTSSSIDRRASVNGIRMSTDPAAITAPPTEFLKELLEHLTGERLLEASSDSWRHAIYEAVGAPDKADSHIVAKALEDAMSNPDNQFAILMGRAEPFEATFPSDTVSYDDDETCWVECRLLSKVDDELLVTMGINLVHQNGNWAIASLDWQDFRDKFYPGLSGREWLRAF